VLDRTAHQLAIWQRGASDSIFASVNVSSRSSCSRA
jgi:hypothetical protein